MPAKTKILYVEDNPLNISMIRRILESRGYDVVAANDGLSGVDLAQTEHPDLVLMDINMPGLDGYEASTMLKGLPSMEHIPIVAFTAKATKGERERMLAAGCDGYISKTTSPQELIEQIEAYLRGKRERLSEAEQHTSARAYQRRLVERLQEKINGLTQANEELTLINNVARAFTSTLNLNELLGLITQLVEETLGVEACSVLLLDEETDELIFRAVSGLGKDKLLNLRLKPWQGIAGWVAQEGQSALINDVSRDPRFYSRVDRLSGLTTRSIVCVPLRVKGKIIGVIQAINKIEGHFSRDSLRLLESLASTAAMGIENARLYLNLREERDLLIRKEEEVRRSIARDLHDGPTQMLSAIVMNADYIRKLLEVAPEKVEAELVSLQKLADEATHDVRTLLFGLHPIVLETKGLQAALEIYAERFIDRRGAKLSLDAPEDLVNNLSQEAEIAAFIIVQEAVNNARKHANAQEITITLRSSADVMSIVVKDNGQGFDLDSVVDNYESRGSFGLRTMAERARLANGEFDLKSTPGQGTTVSLRLPNHPPK